MIQTLSDPERELAISYAPLEKRGHLRALWLFDERLGGIVARTTEPTIGEMRLLWWREALEAMGDGGDGDVPAEPLLIGIADAVRASGGDPAEWAKLAEGWHALLQEPIETAELDRFASDRGGRLFGLSAQILGEEPDEGVRRTGRAWALADLGHRSSDDAVAEDARSQSRTILAELERTVWPRSLRPLGALAALVHRDVTSDTRRKPGSPSRVARMAWHRLTGK